MHQYNLAEGEGFEPPRAWRPLRFSSAPLGVLGRAVRCRLEYESQQFCGG